jgi:2-polyprenyl-6-methoxyphenol hydroxylase-like FAD-dependent oxidoreductase
LHEALLEGVDVRRGKRVVRVKDDREDGAGKVEVVLHDGTVERGDLVIGESTSIIREYQC